MRRPHDAAPCDTDVIRHDRSPRVRGDAVPDLLDGVDRAQARQGDPEPHTSVVPVCGDIRELSRRDELAVLLERRGQQPDRGPDRGRDLCRPRFPGRRVGGEVRFPRPDRIHRDGHRGADGSTQRARHPRVPAPQPSRPGGQPARGDRLLPRDRPPIHGVDPAWVHRQCTRGPRGGGDGGRGEPRGRVPSHRVSARRTRPGRDGHLRVHPGLERVHHRLRALELLVEANAHDLACLFHDAARDGLGRADGRRDLDEHSGGRVLPDRSAPRCRRGDRGRGQGLIVESIERLADRCLLPGFIGTDPPDWILRRAAAGLRGVCLYARHVESPRQLSALTSRLHAENPRLVIAIDEEGGDVTRLEASTGSSYPGNLALGTVDDIELTRSVARSMGAELAAAGVDLDLAPVADVNSNPINPVIGVRAFGSTPDRVAAHTAGWVDGLQDAGVAACAKHFPGHGDTSLDSHLDLPVVEQDPHEGALEPFRAAIASGVRAVMSAHILVVAIDRLPGTISAKIMTGLLRGELGFEGLAVSDGLEMRAIADGVGLVEGTVLALAAGCDLLCIGGGLAGEDVAVELRDAIVAAVRAGRVSEARLAEAAARVDALAVWRSRQPRRATPDKEIGLAAARRAISADGSVRVDGHPVVVQLISTPSQAAGVVPWGIATSMVQLGARVTAVELDAEHADMVATLGQAAGRSLVLVVKNLHRHPWMALAVDAALAKRPDAIVVEMGLPACRPAGAAAYIATHGAARVCGVAAAEVLVGR